MYTTPSIIFKLNLLEKKIDDLDSKMDIIIELLKDNNKDCKKMTNHINFINGIYENVKAPMNYICNSINKNILTDKKT